MTARAVDLLCGRSTADHTAPEYKSAIHMVTTDQMAMHMLEQCVRHKQGKSTTPYELPPNTDRDYVRCIQENGWHICVRNSWTLFAGSAKLYTVHKPPYV